MEWHHLIGLTLKDFFTGSAFHVELEKDLSLKHQFLDVVIIEQAAGQPIAELPDGLENLARHNLMTYKSPRESLVGWSLDELLGHYVNYRKQISPSFKKLLPVDDFRLYAVCTREPEKLATEVAMTSLKEGVYEIPWGTQRIRLIVLSQVPKIKRNSIWQLFSGIAEKAQYGAAQYKWRRKDHSTIIRNLYNSYQAEGIAMPYDWNDFYREFTKENLNMLRAEERLKGLRAEEIEAYLKKLRKRQRRKSKSH